MKSSIEGGVIYLALAAGIAYLWVTGTGGAWLDNLRAAAAGHPAARIPIPTYRGSVVAGAGRLGGK